MMTPSKSLPGSPSIMEIGLSRESESLLRGEGLGTPSPEAPSEQLSPESVALSPHLGSPAPIDISALPTYNLDTLISGSTVLAEGGFGKILKCNIDGDNVALKTGNGLRHEVAMLQRISRCGGNPRYSRRIVRILGVACGRSTDGVVLELMACDLQSIISKKRLTFPEARYLARGVSEGLRALQECSVTHGDLKPSNILIKGRSIKLCDFGSANNTLAVPKSTTQGYRTPEALIGVKKSRRSFETDQWCLGVLLVESLLQVNPFNHGSIHALWSMCCIGSPPFPHPIAGIDEEETLPFHELSLGPKSPCAAAELVQSMPLLQKLLHLTPSQRPSPEETLLHPFCAGSEECDLSCAEAPESPLGCITPPRASAFADGVTPPSRSGAASVSQPRGSDAGTPAPFLAAEALPSPGCMRRM